MYSMRNKVISILRSRTPEEYCKKAGIDLVRIYKELGRIATESMVYVKDRDGEVLELGPDNKSRIPAIALILELNKHLKDKGTVTNVGIFNDPKIIEEAKRVVGIGD